MPLFSIFSQITFPKLPYQKIKETILGKKYTLEVSIVGRAKASSINRRTRQKTYAPNVLSFPYTKQHGEIVLCPTIAKLEAKPYGMTYEGYFGFLFIHGLLHLKGYDHSNEMEKLEQKYAVKFHLK